MAMDGRLLALISASLFSLGPVALSFGYRTSTAELAALTSIVLGLPLLLLLSPLFGGLRLQTLTPTSLTLFAVGGVLGPLAGRTLLYVSIRRLGSSRAFTIQNTAPLITTLAAIALLAEPISLQRWLAIGAIVGGLVVIGKRSSASPSPLRVSGVVFALLAAFSFGIRPVVFKLGFNQSPDPMTASVVGAAAALLGYLLFLAVSGKLHRLQFDRRSLLPFLIAAAVHNLGFLIVNFAFNADDVSLVYPINSTSPLLTFVLSYYLLKNVERLAVWDLMGTLAIVAGVVILFT